jgi:hypothetical protein
MFLSVVVFELFRGGDSFLSLFLDSFWLFDEDLVLLHALNDNGANKAAASKIAEIAA